MRRRLLIYLRLGLVLAVLLVLLVEPVLVGYRVAAAATEGDGRLVRLEVQMAAMQEQHKLLLGLIVADLLGTMALLRKKAVAS